MIFSNNKHHTITMINATKEEIVKAYEAKATEFQAALDKTMAIMDNYQAAIERDAEKDEFEKARTEYSDNIVQYAENNDRLSLEFSKIAGLALYHELAVDMNLLSVAMNYVDQHRPE